ncbi:hypothetical protein [Streptomyces sp. NRRL S-646]|nr:hypothetical protein [Streptomyces sp. NRRL S-646]
MANRSRSPSCRGTGVRSSTVFLSRLSGCLLTEADGRQVVGAAEKATYMP